MKTPTRQQVSRKKQRMTTGALSTQTFLKALATDIAQSVLIEDSPLFEQFIEYFAQNPNEAALVCLFENGVDLRRPSVFKGWPLWFFIVEFNPNVQILELVLQSQVDVNYSSEKCETTALHIASRRNSGEFCELLLKYKARFSLGRMGRQAIHEAARSGSDSLQCLINHGANVNAATAVGVTPLHVGASNRSTIYSLVQAGADINSKDTGGRNAAFFLLTHLADQNIASLFDLVVCGIDFQLFDSYKKPIWAYIHARRLPEERSDFVAAIFHMSGGLVDWQPDQRAPTSVRIWENCTGANQSQRFIDHCNGIVSLCAEEMITVCVALQGFQLPSLILCEILFEMFPCWRRFKFCEIWDLVVMVRHFHERNQQ